MNRVFIEEGPLQTVPVARSVFVGLLLPQSAVFGVVLCGLQQTAPGILTSHGSLLPLHPQTIFPRFIYKYYCR